MLTYGNMANNSEAVTEESTPDLLDIGAACSSTNTENNKDDNPSCSTSTVDGAGNGFRVKNVSEINEDVENGNEAIATGSNSVKRKLPAWMMDGETNSRENESNPRQKRRKSSVNNEESEEPVTSGNSEEATQSAATVKLEKTADNAAEANVDAPSNEAEPAVLPSTSNAAAAQIRIKPEPNDQEEEEDSESQTIGIGVLNPVDVKPSVKVEIADASSSTRERESCKFGIRCYRRNGMHRAEEAHPGDPDYKRPNFPPPPLGTPFCPYGNSCYRRNPVHFQQYCHPPDTDFKQNYKNHMRLRQRRQQQKNTTAGGNDSDRDDYDLDDPFIDDGDSDYVPSSDDDLDN